MWRRSYLPVEVTDIQIISERKYIRYSAPIGSFIRAKYEIIIETPNYSRYLEEEEYIGRDELNFKFYRRLENFL